MAAVVVFGVGMALELKRVVVNNLIRVSYRCIAITFTLTFLFTQVARQSASVIKVVVVSLCIHILMFLKRLCAISNIMYNEQL